MSDPRFDATPYAVLASLRCAGVTLTHRYDSTTKRFHATASQGDVQPGEGSAATLRDAALDAVHSLACSHDRGEQENRAILGELAADRAPHYAIGALVRAGLAERETQQSVSQRGVAVQKTLLRLRAAEVA